MKVSSGFRMVGLFSLNFAGPRYYQLKRNAKKPVQFILREHAKIFFATEKIYRDAKLAHNIVDPVLIILAVDETKAKRKVAWESKKDIFASYVDHLKTMYVSLVSNML